MNEKRDIGAEILNGIRELKQGKTGRVVNIPAVAEVRRLPSGAARTLLMIAHKNPMALLEVT